MKITIPVEAGAQGGRFGTGRIEMGVVYDVPFEQYLKSTGLSATELKLLNVSALEYYYFKQHGSDENASMTTGRLAHTAILEPDVFAQRTVVYPGRRSGKDWEAFKAANTGKDILTGKEMEQLKNMAFSVRSHPVASGLLARGRAEISVFWNEGCRPAKCRIDFEAPRVNVELKTTANPEPRAFFNQSYRLGYHIQYAWYRRGFLAATGEDKPIVVITVGTSRPYDVVCYTTDNIVLAEGNLAIKAALDRLDECSRTGVYHGYSNEMMAMQIPNWAYADTSTVSDVEDISNEEVE